MEPEIRHKPVRYYEIDLLRFLAAFMVVMFHFTFRGYHGEHMNPIEYRTLGDFFKYGYLGVDLFFIISGYVVLMSAQGKTLSQFFISRVTRLYPAYWVACTLCFLVVRFFGPPIHTLGWSPMLDAPVVGYLYNMTMLHAFFGVHDLDGVYWTLTIELVFYFLIALLISFQWFKHLLTVLTVWLVYCALVGPISNAGPFSFLFFPRYAPFFIAGMTLYLLQTKQAAPWKLYSLLLAAYLLGIRATYEGALTSSKDWNYFFSPLIVAVVVTLFFGVFLLIIHRKLAIGQAKWVSWLGALTYPIYLLHHNVCYVVFQRVGNSINKYVLLTLLLAAVFVAAYLLHVFVERRYGKALGTKLQQLLAKA